MFPKSIEELDLVWAEFVAAHQPPSSWSSISKAYEMAGIILSCYFNPALCDSWASWLRAFQYGVAIMRLEGQAKRDFGSPGSL